MACIRVTTTLSIEAPDGSPPALRAAMRTLADAARNAGLAVRGRGESVFRGEHVEIDANGPTLPTEHPEIGAALARVLVVAAESFGEPVAPRA